MGDKQQQRIIDIKEESNDDKPISPRNQDFVCDFQMQRDRNNEIEKKFEEIQNVSKKFEEIQKKYEEIEKKFKEIQNVSKKFEEIQNVSKKFEEIQKTYEEIEKKFKEIQNVSKKFEEIQKKYEEIEMKFKEIEKKFKEIQKSSCAVSDLQMQLAQSDEHKNLKGILDVYLSMKNGSSVSRDSMEIQDNDNPIFTQVTPSGNTVLHIAAMYGNHYWVDKTLQNAQNLLTTQNANGDTPLHVAARTQHISILHKLFNAHLNSLSFPLSDDATMELETTLLLQNNKEIISSMRPAYPKEKKM